MGKNQKVKKGDRKHITRKNGEHKKLPNSKNNNPLDPSEKKFASENEPLDPKIDHKSIVYSLSKKDLHENAVQFKELMVQTLEGPTCMGDLFPKGLIHCTVKTEDQNGFYETNNAGPISPHDFNFHPYAKIKKKKKPNFESHFDEDDRNRDKIRKRTSSHDVISPDNGEFKKKGIETVTYFLAYNDEPDISNNFSQKRSNCGYMSDKNKKDVLKNAMSEPILSKLETTITPKETIPFQNSPSQEKRKVYLLLKDIQVAIYKLSDENASVEGDKGLQSPLCPSNFSRPEYSKAYNAKNGSVSLSEKNLGKMNLDSEQIIHKTKKVAKLSHSLQTRNSSKKNYPSQKSFKKGIQDKFSGGKSTPVSKIPKVPIKTGKKAQNKFLKLGQIENEEKKLGTSEVIHIPWPGQRENKPIFVKDKAVLSGKQVKKEQRSNNQNTSQKKTKISVVSQLQPQNKSHIPADHSLSAFNDSQLVGNNVTEILNDSSYQDIEQGNKKNTHVTKKTCEPSKNRQGIVTLDFTKVKSTPLIQLKGLGSKKSKTQKYKPIHSKSKNFSPDPDSIFGFKDQNMDEKKNSNKHRKTDSESQYIIKNDTQHRDYKNEESDDQDYSLPLQNSIDDSSDNKDVEDEDFNFFDFEPNDSFLSESNQNCESLSTFELLVKPTKFRKRNRTIMTDRQSDFLKRFFTKNPFPNTSEREELGRVLNMRPRTVQIWFQNMRQKNKSKIKHFSPYNKLKNEDNSKENGNKGSHEVSLERIRPSNLKSRQNQTAKGTSETDSIKNQQYRSNHFENHVTTSPSEFKQDKAEDPNEYQQFRKTKGHKDITIKEQKGKKDHFVPELLDLRGLNALAELADNILDQEKKPKSQR